jgi:hypothetical protein
MAKAERKARLYVVTDRAAGGATAVKAYTADDALRFVTRDRVSVRPATAEDYIRKEDVKDATVPGVHPDQQPLTLPAGV